MNVLHKEMENDEITALFGWSSLNEKAIIVNMLIFETEWHIWKNRNNVKYGLKLPLNQVIIVHNIQKCLQNRLEIMNDETLLELFHSNFFQR